MAKRRKEKDEDEEKPFKIPKFDEEAFVKRERRNIKTTFLAFLFGCLMALVCFGFWALMGNETNFRWPLILLVGIANAAFLRYIFLRLNIDLTDFSRRNWFSTYGIYFFTWLLVFIVFTNPPFYDDESPRIEFVSLPDIQEFGGYVLIVAKITDNVRVDYDEITLTITDPDDNVTTISPTKFDIEKIISIFEIKNPDNLTGEFSYVLTAKDVNGQIKKTSGTFSYNEDVIEISNDDELEKMDDNDDIKIDVDVDVSQRNFRVYYTLDDGVEINIDRENVAYKDEYETSPKYEGWMANNNYTMKVYVEVSHYFPNIPIQYSNIVKDTRDYKVSTTDDSGIGDETPPMPWNWTKYFKGEAQAPVLLNYDQVKVNSDTPLHRQIILPYPVSVQTPGFELIIFLVAIFAILIIFKYKKKNNNHK
jgi:hypothetical protein